MTSLSPSSSSLSHSNTPISQTSSYVVKVLVVGDAATGKSSIIRRYVDNDFSPHHRTTLGVDFKLKSLKINHSIINMQLWDIAGQDRFAGLARLYYRDAVAACVVFDYTSISSFQNAQKWKNDIDSKVFLSDGQSIPVVLIGNKYDLIEHRNERAISDQTIEKFCNDHHFFHWFPTSAKTGYNVKECFHSLLSKIHENLQNEPEKSSQTQNDQIDLNNPEDQSSCCF